MSFETIYDNITQKGLEIAGTGTVRVSARIDVKTPLKKVLGVHATAFPGGTEQTDGEARITGRVVTRVVYIDENGDFNSEERSDTFNERFPLKEGMGQVIPYATVLETNITDTSPGGIDAASTISVSLLGICAKTVRYVTDLKGDAECKRDQMAVSSFAHTLTERFEEQETFDLSQNCEGILGTDVTAAIRDINSGDGKVTVKGTINANVLASRGGEDARAYNTNYDWDFTKTITAKEIGIEDLVQGNLVVTAVTVKAERTTKPEVKITVELMFCGHSVTRIPVDYVVDCFCYENALEFNRTPLDAVTAAPQHNSVTDIEGNMLMPDGSPFIAKVLTTDGARITGINVIPADNKITLEGVVTANMVYECEEHGIHAQPAMVPFSSVIKLEGVTPSHAIQVSASVINCNIKARRGRELLVDARLALSVCANSVTTSEILCEVTAGAPTARDDSAITILIAAENETLWDLAKRTATPTAEILRQNPTLPQAIPTGERILIYRQQVINF